jgi:hypothetical protein
MSIFQAAQIVLSTVLYRSAGVNDPYKTYHTNREFEEALGICKEVKHIPTGIPGEFTIRGAVAIAKEW